MKHRCNWAGNHPLMIAYHDTQWGVPLHDDRELFGLLLLESAQAGLSWQTILNKRENYRKAFDDFDPDKIARYDQQKIASLLNDPGIVRNRLKIQSAITNAQFFLDIQEKYGSFDAYIWKFVDGTTLHNKRQTMKDIPATTHQSDAMSKALKKRGFKFVGSTICYAYMQSAGLVNDHLVNCFRYEEINKLT